MNWHEWLTGFAGASLLEWVATLAGFLCVYLLIKRNIWSFAFGLIQVSIYAWIFFDVKLYSDMALHVFYIGFQFYGWWVWRHSSNENNQILVEKGSPKEYLLWVCAVVTSTVILGTLMQQNTDASFPYPDAFTTCASLAAQWLLSHRRLWNWSLWIIVDIVAIAIYWQKGLYPTSLLYSSLLIMACVGQWQWYQNLTSQRKKELTSD
ncbi:nicotinamide riboside transporter PnuC [Paraglaciecola sp.]|uniref:nicotinamide riboside transporter PnuC n=1 Tax=Paraglaciecola sp. TaxID=1920173 RepID=UPI003263DAAB